MVPTPHVQQKIDFSKGFTKFPNHMWGRFKPSTSYVWIALQSTALEPLDEYPRPWDHVAGLATVTSVVSQKNMGLQAMLRKHGVLGSAAPAATSGTRHPRQDVKRRRMVEPKLVDDNVPLVTGDDPLWREALRITNARFPIGKNERQLQLIAEHHYGQLKDRETRSREKSALAASPISPSLQQRLRRAG